MKQLLYLEIPTPQIATVQAWLQQRSPAQFSLPRSPAPAWIATEVGVRLEWQGRILSLFTWQVLNTTYLKAFQWTDQPLPRQKRFLRELATALRTEFPCHPAPFPEEIDLSQQNIFTALAPYYPQTAHHFQQMPNGEADLQRAYWWEKRWRASVQSGFADLSGAQPMVFDRPTAIVHQPPPVSQPDSTWDIVIVGGALGALNAAMMARLGYRVALVERIKFGRMNREWNISRSELQTLVEIGLLTRSELESVIAREYRDNFNLFFCGNNPPQARSGKLHTPTVLNIAMDCDRLLQLCGEKLVAAGGQIFEQTEFQQAFLEPEQITSQVKNLETGQVLHLRSRLLIDAMGTTSPIAQQITGGRAFDSVCPTIGGVVKNGFAPGVWDSNYGEPLLTSGDISRGRQLIWEMFPGHGDDITIYLFYYHQIRPDNPGSILELFEDFFTCLPEYRRCEVDQLEWRKAAFGYIPGRFSRGESDRQPGYDRVLSIGDAACLSSPLIFTGFGSLVRNLPRITHLLHSALELNLLTGEDLGRVNAYQDNLAVTWIFSRGMMARPHPALPPNWINTTLNTFFGILTDEPSEPVDDFIKDRGSWLFMTASTLKAGLRTPLIPWWVLQSIGFKALLEWVGVYITFTFATVLSWLFRGWIPQLVRILQPLMSRYWPRLWHRLLAWSYRLTYGMGQPRLQFQLPSLTSSSGTMSRTGWEAKSIRS
jgi:lycopene cyclase CruA